MAWPTVIIDTSNMDSPTDSAGNARAAIKQMADNINNIKDSRGAANGIPSLDPAGKVPLNQLPTIPASQGGTGQSGGYTVGDILYASGANTLSKLAAGASGRSLTSNGAGAAPSWQETAGMPSGTRLAFQQTTAPTGWTKDTNAAINDSIMRLVTGTVSSGGSLAFSTFAGQNATGAHTLTTAQIPSHAHSQQRWSSGSTSNGQLSISTSLGQNNGLTSWPGGAMSVSNSGSGGSHSHPLTQDLKYYDFIIASKN